VTGAPPPGSCAPLAHDDARSGFVAPFGMGVPPEAFLFERLSTGDQRRHRPLMDVRAFPRRQEPCGSPEGVRPQAVDTRRTAEDPRGASSSGDFLHSPLAHGLVGRL
jgi:hypothetical protein